MTLVSVLIPTHDHASTLGLAVESALRQTVRDIEVLIGQLVSINGAKLSKRAGNIIELDDLQAWLGTDALRYTLARYPADSPLAIDPEVLQRRGRHFYVAGLIGNRCEDVLLHHIVVTAKLDRRHRRLRSARLRRGISRAE